MCISHSRPRLTKCLVGFFLVQLSFPLLNVLEEKTLGYRISTRYNGSDLLRVMFPEKQIDYQ